MQHIYAKLQSQRGVSILYGLLFMMVALMVTVVMLDASVTAAKRVHSDEERTQDMLTLQSAAETLRTCLDNTTFTTSVTLDDSGVVTAAEVTGSSGPLASFLSTSFTSAVNQTVTSGYVDITVDELPIEVDTDGKAEVLEDATVEFSYIMPTKTHTDAHEEEMYSLRITLVMPNSDRQLFIWAKSTTTTSTTDATHKTETTSWTLQNIAINTQKDKLWEQTS